MREKQENSGGEAMEKCQDCRYFKRDVEEKTEENPLGNSVTGLCRVRSPVVLPLGATYAPKWPSIWDDDWCGEFKVILNDLPRESASQG